MKKIHNIREFIRNHWKILLIITLLIGTLGSYYYIQSRNNAQSLIESTIVKRGTLRETRTLSGEIASRGHSTVLFQTGGTLAHIAVKEGQVVTKGQYLASLDQRQLQKNLQKELNDYMKTRWAYDQKKDDYDDTITSDTIKRIIDSSQFDLNNAVLDVELQQISRDLSVITSPIRGIVTQTYNLQPGVTIPIGTPVVEIVDPDSLYFTLTADQTEVTTLTEGLKGALLLDAYLDEELPGTISRIAFTPKSGESSTVYEVEFEFALSSNSQLKYRTGMTGDVDFITQEKKDALYIPFKYITEKDGQSFVTVMENGKKVQRPVETGIDTDESIEIQSGLSEGEVIYN